MRPFLTPDEHKALECQHRCEKDRRCADRIKAVLLANKGWSFIRIAEALLLDRETISRHIWEFREEQKLSTKSGGSKGKLTSEQTSDLMAHLEHVTYLKVIDICVYVQKTYGVVYTISGMTAWLKAHRFSYKKPKGTPAKADLVQQEEFVKSYESLKFKTPEEEPILFADGVHPTMATKITYGWIRQGKDKLIPTIASRTRVNLMGALNLATMGLISHSYKTLNSVHLEHFFDLVKAAYPDAPKIHMILDNGPYNVSALTKEAARKRNIILHYLPPYSPNLNAIERLWKVMNECVRNNRIFRTATEFQAAIREFCENTWPKIAMSMVDRINDNFQKLKASV